MKTHNFSAGPSILPQSVITNASKKLLELDNELSILEISHRSNAFSDVMSESISLVRAILKVPSNYSIIFLQGGASLQFCMVALNLLKKKGITLALGGGAFMNKSIRKEVLENHISFWLNLNDKIIIERIKGSVKRPMAINSTKEELLDLLK